MRKVMLIAAILSVMPGFVCGMENEREEDVSLFEGLCVQQVMKEDLKPQPPSVMRMIKEDRQARKNKISRGLVEVGFPKCCADGYGIYESICLCGCLEVSLDRFMQEGDVDLRDTCPTFLFLSATTAAVIAGMAVGATESNMMECFYSWSFFIGVKLLPKRTVDLWCMRKKKSE